MELPSPNSPESTSGSIPTIRTAAGFSCGLGLERIIGTAPASFTRLQLISERFATIAVHRRQQDLAASRQAGKSRFIRGHIEADIEAMATLDHVEACLPLVMGGVWRNRNQASVAKQYLSAGISSNIGTASIIRRYADGDEWYLATGLKCHELMLTFDDFGEARLRLRLYGMAMEMRLAKDYEIAKSTDLVPISLAQRGAKLTLNDGQGVSYETGEDPAGDIILAGVSLRIQRPGIRPLFAMHGNKPFGISDAGLTVSLGLKLLVNDRSMAFITALNTLAEEPVFEARLVLPVQTGHTLALVIPKLQKTNHRIAVLGPGQSAMITLDCDAIITADPSSTLLRATISRGGDDGAAVSL